MSRDAGLAQCVFSLQKGVLQCESLSLRAGRTTAESLRKRDGWRMTFSGTEATTARALGELESHIICIYANLARITERLRPQMKQRFRWRQTDDSELGTVLLQLLSARQQARTEDERSLQLHETNQQLTQALQEAQERCATLLCAQRHSESKANALTQDLEAEQLKVLEMRATWKSAEEQTMSKSDELLQLSEKHRNLQESMIDLTSRKASIQAAWEEAVNQVNSKNRLLLQLDEASRILQESILDLAKQNASIQVAWKEAEEQAISKSDELLQLSEKHRQLQKENAALMREKKAAQDTVAFTMARCRRAEEIVAEFEEALETTRKSRDAYAMQAKASDTRVLSLQSQVSQLSNQLRQIPMGSRHLAQTTPQKMAAELRQWEEWGDKMRCVICLDNLKEALFQPCNHLCVCMTCSRDLSTCPLCRKAISLKQKAYYA